MKIHEIAELVEPFRKCAKGGWNYSECWEHDCDGCTHSLIEKIINIIDREDIHLEKYDSLFPFKYEKPEFLRPPLKKELEQRLKEYEEKFAKCTDDNDKEVYKIAINILRDTLEEKRYCNE